jgi:hypothetical protein
MNTRSHLGYVLTTPRRDFVWIGGGLRHVSRMDLTEVKLWASKADAARAARAILRAIGLRLGAQPLALTTR